MCLPFEPNPHAGSKEIIYYLSSALYWIFFKLWFVLSVCISQMFNGGMKVRNVSLCLSVCLSVPIIKVPPQSQVNGTGSSLVFLCEVFAFPMALVEWRKEGRDIILPGDDPHISVQVWCGTSCCGAELWLCHTHIYLLYFSLGAARSNLSSPVGCKSRGRSPATLEPTAASLATTLAQLRPLPHLGSWEPVS